MTLYDLLRRLLPGPAWQEWELAEARDLIAELERLNIFGTTARLVSEQHEHQWQELRLPGSPPRYDYTTRSYIPAPPPLTVERCAVCGKDKQ